MNSDEYLRQVHKRLDRSVCPVCGSPVVVVTADEGTKSYIPNNPLVAASAYRRALSDALSLLDRVRDGACDWTVEELRWEEEIRQLAKGDSDDEKD